MVDAYRDPFQSLPDEELVNDTGVERNWADICSQVIAEMRRRRDYTLSQPDSPRIFPDRFDPEIKPAMGDNPAFKGDDGNIYYDC